MAIISLEQAKMHLRVDASDEDSHIALFIGAAQEQVEGYLNRKVYEAEAEAQPDDDRPMVANFSVRAAMLLIIGDLYASREDSTDSVNRFPQASRRLLDPYRIGQGV